jgi:putative ABC transport system substrate-binding protein
MRLIGLLVTFALSLFTALLAADAQPTGKVYRIGYLSGGDASTPLLVPALRDLGYVEGQNLVVARRAAEGKLDRLPTLVAELVQLKVDLIVAGGTPAASVAKQATQTIPIVFLLAADPVGSGLVASLARPSGNVTGFTAGQYGGKQLEALREAVPGLVRVAILWDANYVQRPGFDAPRRLGLKAQFLEVRGADDFDGAFVAAGRGRAGGVLVENTPMLNNHHKRIAELAAKHRLPAVSHSRSFVNFGGLLAYGPEPTNGTTRVAALVDKILKGAKPADLPVEQPTKFELVINLKTAKALGLTIPPTLLLQATQVIE